ncbi:MAG: helix-turn-helix domain-containing protein, partial [Cloacibacterium sp.]|nr:helix-turn-helix domain-containing protein [Cloacibacterium sp.]
FLHISVPTIIDWRKNKNLPHYNFNGRYYYSKKELLEYGKNRRN